MRYSTSYFDNVTKTNPFLHIQTSLFFYKNQKKLKVITSYHQLLIFICEIVLFSIPNKRNFIDRIFIKSFNEEDFQIFDLRTDILIYTTSFQDNLQYCTYDLLNQLILNIEKALINYIISKDIL